jgi:hypothetical protein
VPCMCIDAVASLPESSPACESAAMLRPPFPSQRVRALHAYVGTIYVFTVRSRKQPLDT